ncbi:hypothetical protein SAMN02910350_01803 [Pseudobutyrivibrio xylanivorans]|uniref:Uncharacterized protein n=1 Tax=Pseudobutyrivibrio xylanivorans TaxID=185007 RepID=A0A1G5S1Q8_PSEXY|nr:hypothetical protein SAMN02910350_01803 [Pseudobutyrivibrio xylanivorans]
MNLELSAAIGTAVTGAAANFIASSATVATIAAGTGVAAACVAAAPIAIGVGVAVGASILIDKIADVEVGGKSVKDHVKDGFYSGVKATENLVSDGFDAVKGLFH